MSRTRILWPSAAVLIFGTALWLIFSGIRTGYDLKCIIPLWGMVTVMSIYHVISQFLWNKHATDRNLETSTVQSLNQKCSSWLVIWYSSWLASIPIWIAAIIISPWFNSKTLDWGFFWVFFLQLIISLILVVVNVGGHRRIESRFPEPAGADAFMPGSHTFDYAPILLAKTGDSSRSLRRAYGLGRLFGFLAGYQIVFHFCVSLISADRSDLKNQLLACAGRMQQIHVTLTLLAAIMGIGLIRMYVLQQYVIARLDEPSQKSTQPKSDAAVLFFAVYYSALIAAAYIPTMVIFQCDWRDIVGENAGPDLETALKQTGLSTFKVEVFEPLVAILTPILTGAGSVALRRLTGSDKESSSET